MGRYRSLQLSDEDRSTVRAVLFDCDGVICPPMRFAKLLKEKYGITRETTAEFFTRYFNPALKGEADVLDLLPPFLTKWGWRHTPEDFLSQWLASERATREELIAIIQELKERGYVVGLATNQERRRANYMRTEMKFGELFDHCFISSEIGAMKPESQFFEKVTDSLKIDPSAILFIDDQKHYLDAAELSGWKTILYQDENDLRSELAVFLKD